MKKHHWINSLHIIGLVIITGILAIILGIFLPKKSQAPTANQDMTNQSTEQNNPPTPLPEVIQFNNITDNNRVSPKQVITGTVPGNWFFEGSFPVFLKKPSGEIFATVIAKTDEDWMVTKNVSFSVPIPE
jgi:cytoskeletal protein RodZ